MAKPRVFVDTNVIIESFRVNCWVSLCNRYSVETVETCFNEALAGNPNKPGYNPVNRTVLANGLTALHAVSPIDIARFTFQFPEHMGLDDGELHLLAWLHPQNIMSESLIMISTADRAAVRATGELGWLDSLVSLEELANKSGVSKNTIQNLLDHYKINWLSTLKTKIILDLL